MKNDAGLFRTRVAQRMMALFLFGSLVPILALGVTSYIHVSDQLEDQARQRLGIGAKNAAIAVMERLHFVEAELGRVAGILNSNPGADQVQRLLSEVGPSGFTALGLSRPDGSLEQVLANTPAQPELTVTQHNHLWLGRTVLVVRANPEVEVLLAKAVDPARQDRGVLLAIVDPAYLWSAEGDGRRLPAGTEMCVYARENLILTCDHLESSPVSSADPDPQMADTWTWRAHGEEYLAATGTVMLGLDYAAPFWTVILGEPRSSVMAPLVDFRQNFPLILLLAMAIVLGVIHIHVRRSMEPLRALTDATRRIARQEFDTHVVIASDDEFEDLAGSFNAMAQRLGRQFGTLTAMSDIDRAALSQSDREEMTRTILERMSGALRAQRVALLLQGEGPDASWSKLELAYRRWQEDSVVMDGASLAELARHPEGLEVEPGATRGYLEPWSPAEAANLILPLVRAGAVIGMVVVDYSDTEIMAAESRAARQLADQVAIALANASLLEDLDALSSGALTALARTIDANSPWTAGHSERVTYVSLRVGEGLGLSIGELDTLYRGGLLHDIGKIAIPAAILNKPGALSDEEFAAVRQHPATGARILSPIGVYQDTIPVVLSHHERLDGSGYPQGLVGEQIPILARVAAVADVYDALTSARPYRAGWPVERVVEHLTAGSAQFDPDVTGALVGALEDGLLDMRSNGKPVPPRHPAGLRDSGVQNAVSLPHAS